MKHLSLLVLTLALLLANTLLASPDWKPAKGSGYPAETFLATDHLGTKLMLSNVPGKRPLVLLLHGSDGGVGMMKGGEAWHLLNRGFHVLGSTYFDRDSAFPGPKHLARVRLESFMEEIQEYVSAHRDVIDEDKIGVVGVSKGGELSLLLASLYPQFKFVVAIVPADVAFQHIWPTAVSSWDYQGKEVPFVVFPKTYWDSVPCVITYVIFVALMGIQQTVNNAPKWMGLPYLNLFKAAVVPVECQSMHTEAMRRTPNLEEATFKVENINGPVLLVSGKDEQFWPSDLMSERVMERLKAHNFKHPSIHLPFSGGDLRGHFSYAYPAGYRAIFDTLGLMLQCEQEACEKNGIHKAYRDAIFVHSAHALIQETSPEYHHPWVMAGLKIASPVVSFLLYKASRRLRWSSLLTPVA